MDAAKVAETIREEHMEGEEEHLGQTDMTSQTLQVQETFNKHVAAFNTLTLGHKAAINERTAAANLEISDVETALKEIPLGCNCHVQPTCIAAGTVKGEFDNEPLVLSQTNTSNPPGHPESCTC